MAVRTQPQLGIDELVIHDDRIEAALNSRQRLKSEFDRARVEYEEADEKAKAMLADLELIEGAARIAGWRITKTYIPSRTTQPFETKARNQIRITPIAAD